MPHATKCAGHLRDAVFRHQRQNRVRLLRISGTTDSGALLVRPDLHVAYRADAYCKSASTDLVQAMSVILGRTSGQQVQAAE
ncbi:aromatic-ring hydroxylase C-terminal domain-containing protein [Litoreibacter roseus]|uniref:aromatic-ring hydroxylase C-terminal domain-containing protein n=1 Tax=Litoreibacter roseus TaxID=2601869 RepID=UPI003571037F